MDLTEAALIALYPQKSSQYSGRISYSGHFKGYNAAVRLNKTTNEISFRLSKQWRNVSNEIKVGMLQDLLVRLFKEKRHTLNMDLYANFIKALHKTIPKTKTHPLIEQSFHRVNDSYFYGMIERPNLIVGKSVNTLGHYEYATDTVMIAEFLLPHPHLVDFVVYHELLHKKHQFTLKAGKSRHHTHAFRKEEKAFKNANILEAEISQLIRSTKRKGWFW